MKTILVAVSLFLSSVAYAANPYDYRVIRVLDGDTVEIDASFLPVELKQTLRLRIIDVDTPEKGSLAKCKNERDRAEAATRFTRTQIANAKRHQVVLVKWDKYGGRVLGDVLLDGKSLKQMLLENFHAYPYDGGKKRSWC
jgi:endonuclease YncB( thermonuclease family)